MTVAELIEELQEIDGDAIVVVCIDEMPSSGDFKPVETITVCAYDPGCEDVGAPEDGFTGDDIEPCVVLWPEWR